MNLGYTRLRQARTSASPEKRQRLLSVLFHLVLLAGGLVAVAACNNPRDIRGRRVNYLARTSDSFFMRPGPAARSTQGATGRELIYVKDKSVAPLPSPRSSRVSEKTESPKIPAVPPAGKPCAGCAPESGGVIAHAPAAAEPGMETPDIVAVRNAPSPNAPADRVVEVTVRSGRPVDRVIAWHQPSGQSVRLTKWGEPEIRSGAAIQRFISGTANAIDDRLESWVFVAVGADGEVAVADAAAVCPDCVPGL